MCRLSVGIGGGTYCVAPKIPATVLVRLILVMVLGVLDGSSTRVHQSLLPPSVWMSPTNPTPRPYLSFLRSSKGLGRHGNYSQHHFHCHSSIKVCTMASVALTCFRSIDVLPTFRAPMTVGATTRPCRVHSVRHGTNH